MSEDEAMMESLVGSDYERDLGEEAEERRQPAGQAVGHIIIDSMDRKKVVWPEPELPLLPPSSAGVGRGNEADGNAKAEGEAQGEAKGKAKGKAKAKAKAKGKATGKAKAKGEPQVEGPRSDEPQEASEGSQAKA